MNQTDKKKLLRYIQEVSFAIDDVVLYLDTHPYDEEALKYYKKYKKLYHEASEEYTQYYGPLQTCFPNFWYLFCGQSLPSQ